MRHKMHTYATGGFFHCANCKCGKAQELGPFNAKCSSWDDTQLLPEESLMLLSKLGVPIGWFWKEDAGKVRLVERLSPPRG